MKILAITSAVPFRRHNEAGVTAIHLVSYALLKSFLALGHGLSLQMLFNPFRATRMLTEAEQREVAHLQELGIQVLPPLGRQDYQRDAPPASRLRQWCRAVWRMTPAAGVRPFYPAVALRDVVGARAVSSGTEAILTIWSPEGVAATHGLRGIPRIAYHGDPEFYAQAVRGRDRALFFSANGADARPGIRRRLSLFCERAQLAQFRRAHLRLMRQVQVIANVTASNVDFYRRHGHQRTVYIRNTWDDGAGDGRGVDDLAPQPEEHAACPVKIIGHVGYLNRTGSTYGLRFLLEDVVPKLRRVMNGAPYQIHLIGGGEVVPRLQPLLKQDGLVVRGYVEDLDRELRSSDVFLLLNNVAGYPAAYTRHLVAWSLGLCLIVHQHSQKAIPEIRHMDNALVGSTADEIAQLVALAATNHEVNRRIREGGRATYARYFTPSRVSQALAEEMARVVPPR